MHSFRQFPLKIGDTIRWFHRPAVMGIINVTEDSFFAASRAHTCADIYAKAESMVRDGADIIDIGACSTRPGSAPVDEQTESDMLLQGVDIVRKAFPELIISVDTFRPEIARKALNHGANIINDISGGCDKMFDVVAENHVPYILTHSRGNAKSMQSLTDYPEGVTAGVIGELSHQYRNLRLRGVADVIIDPGFGFAKTLEQNYQLLANLSLFHQFFDAPLLVGVSRKSMICRAVGCTPADALNGTTAINTIALTQGTQLLRVHDVRQAVESAKIVTLTNNQL